MARSLNRVVGILPLIHLALPMTRGEWVSLPYCDAGGILADGPEIEAALVKAALDKARTLGIRRVVIRSIHPMACIASTHTLYPGKVGMTLALPPSSREMMANLKSKVRSQAQKPIRDGLTAEIGGVRLLDSFFEIFCNNMGALGSLAHSRTWFKQILKGYGNRAHIGLVRLPDGRPVAGGLTLCHGQRVSIPWASALREYNRLNPNMLLYQTLLSHAADLGFFRFDFGRSTPGEGTHRFKRQWGARETELHWVGLTPGMKTHKDLNAHVLPTGKGPGQARAFVANALSHSPVSLLSWLGSRTRKYIAL